jgi:hypothetical protein
VYSYQGRGEGHEEEVNVDIHQSTGFLFYSSRIFPLFYSAPGIPRIIVLLSRQFRLHDYEDLRRWVMSMDFRSSCTYNLRCCSDNRAEMIMSLLYSSELRTFISIEAECITQKGTYKYKLYTKLTDMLNAFAALDLGTKVSPYSALKYLHHEAE